MSKIKLDLKHFKHESSGDKTTTLRHKKDGHLLTIVHDALSPEAQEQLKALGKSAKNAQTPLQADEARDQKMAEGGEACEENQEMYAEGGQAPRERVDVQKAKSMSSGADKPQTIAEGYENVKKEVGSLFEAEGGEVEERKTPWISEDKKEPGNTLNYAKFGKELNKKNRQIHEQGRLERNKKVQKFADGTPVHPVSEAPQEEPLHGQMTPAADPNQGAAMEAPSQAPQLDQMPKQEAGPKMDPERMQLYNQVIMAHGASAASDPTQYMFGPNGEPPKQGFNSFAAKQADKLYEQNQVAAQQASAAGANKAVEDNAVRQKWGMDPIPVPTVGANQAGATPQVNPEQQGLADQQAQQPQAQNQGLAQQASQQGNPLEEPESMLRSGYNKTLSGIEQGAKAQGALGEQQAFELNQQISADRTAQEAFKDQYAGLEKERQNLIQDVKDGYVDPNKYWTGDKNGNGGHSKIMAGIGMILAGFNPTSSPNAAVNFLKFQMEQNLNAQAKNLESKQNLLTHNLRQFGNLRDAAEMTRIQQNDMVSHQLQSAAATAQTPLAKAAALQAAGKFQMDSSGMFQQFAMRRAMMGMAQGGPQNSQAIDKMLGYMRVVNPQMAKEMEARYVPGVGMASIPVPDKVREDLAAHEKLQSAGQDLLQYSKTHTNLIPGTAEYNAGVQKSTILQQFVREGLLGTVFRDSEKPLLKEFVDANPAGALKMVSSQPKLRTLLESNAMSMDVTRKQYGLPPAARPQQPQQTPQAALQWAQANPKDPRAAQILKHLGK